MFTVSGNDSEYETESSYEGSAGSDDDGAEVTAILTEVVKESAETSEGNRKKSGCSSLK